MYQRIEGFGGSFAFNLDLINKNGSDEMIENMFKRWFANIDILRINNYYAINNGNLLKTKQMLSKVKSIKPEFKTLITSWGPPGYLKSNNDHKNGNTIRRNKRRIHV